MSGAVMIGVDAHKRTHTFAVADEVGRQPATRTLAVSSEGHLAALEWLQRWPQRVWAIEDCRHLTRRLEADLLRAGETVVRVPTRLMAERRAATAVSEANRTRSMLWPWLEQPGESRTCPLPA